MPIALQPKILIAYWLYATLANKVSYKAVDNLYPTWYPSLPCQEYHRVSPIKCSNNNDSVVFHFVFGPTVE